MELDFDIERFQDLTLLKLKLKDPLYSTEDIIEWNDRVQLVERELSDIPFVKRKAYGKWLWNNEHELNRWLTYYHLRFLKDDKQGRL
jgi:hypothetical protein